MTTTAELDHHAGALDDECDLCARLVEALAGGPGHPADGVTPAVLRRIVAWLHMGGWLNEAPFDDRGPEADRHRIDVPKVDDPELQALVVVLPQLEGLAPRPRGAVMAFITERFKP